MGRPLTARQQQVYDFIDERITQRGYGPTVREIGEFLGIKSPNGVMCHLRALERKGMINRLANKSRAIELTHRKQRAKQSLNVVGEVGHGECNLFDAPKTMDVLNMLESPECFLLRYNGEGLDSWAIAKGDILVVHPTSPVSGKTLEVIRNGRGGIELQLSQPITPQMTMPQPHLSQPHLTQSPQSTLTQPTSTQPPWNAGLHVDNGAGASAVLPSSAALTVVRNDSLPASSNTKQVLGVVVGLVRTQLVARAAVEPLPSGTNPMQLPLVSHPFKVCNWQ